MIGVFVLLTLFDLSDCESFSIPSKRSDCLRLFDLLYISNINPPIIHAVNATNAIIKNNDPVCATEVELIGVDVGVDVVVNVGEGLVTVIGSTAGSLTGSLIGSTTGSSTGSSAGLTGFGAGTAGIGVTGFGTTTGWSTTGGAGEGFGSV
jgi:hypothetical protein